MSLYGEKSNIGKSRNPILNKKILIIASFSFGVLAIAAMSVGFGIRASKRNKKEKAVKSTVLQVSSQEITEMSSEEPGSEPWVSSQTSEPAKINIDKVISSPKAQVKPSTGKVTTASEYKYDPKEDAQQLDTAKKEADAGKEKDTYVAVLFSYKNAVTIRAIKAAGESTESTISDISSAQTGSSGNTSSDSTESTSASVNSGTEDSSSGMQSSIPAEQSSSQSEASGSESGVQSNTSTNSDAATDSTSSSGSASVPSSDSNEEGWKEIGGKYYYCHEGKLLRGWYSLDGVIFYFDEKTGEKKSSVCIDVSKYQGDIDWNKVKACGVEYAFIRVGNRGYGTGKLCIDPYFVKNIEGATKVGISCGVYFYTAAVDEVEAAQEANFVLDAVKGYKIDLPIVIDQECLRERVAELSNAQRTSNLIAFAETIRRDGNYKVWYYTYYDFLRNSLDSNQLSDYTLWLAYYVRESNAKQVLEKVLGYDFRCWQYTSNGKVDGISGRVDMNIFFPG